LAQQTAPDADEYVGVLRAGRDDLDSFRAALARLHVAGVTVDWPATHAGGHLVDVPTYPFQRRRFWLAPATGGPRRAGPGHPLVAAVIELAGTGDHLLTGHWSAATHPWLTDHDVHGAVVVPGTAFVELALQAGTVADRPRLADLTIEAPLLPRGRVDRPGRCLRLTP